MLSALHLIVFQNFFDWHVLDLKMETKQHAL